MEYGPEVRDSNLFELDRNLQAMLRRTAPELLQRRRSTLSDFGAWVGSAVDREAEYTDRYGPPALEAYDRAGALVNHIRHNPLWEEVEREVYRRGVVGLNYGQDPEPFLLTFSMCYLLAQADISLHCPVTMTGAVAHVLDRFGPGDLREKYLHELVRTDGKALSGGTWATELHGGSDVGATTTRARKDGDAWRLDGLKWFTSNANGGLAVATARPEGAPKGGEGLGLYLVPTHLDDGTRNPMRIRRLKNKLGTTGVPTGEIDLADTWAAEVASPPDGLRLMMEALLFSRLHNAVASVGMQRRAFLEAMSFCTGRKAFGATITRYPMVQDELLRIMVQLEAGCALTFEAVRAFDAALADDAGRPWLRMATALAKYQTAEEAVAGTRAAMEIIGGNAYTRDYVLHRLIRDAQVLTIWEGPANIQALEMLRLLGNRHPGWEAFESRMEALVDNVPDGLRALAGTVRERYGECRETVDWFRGDPEVAQRHARRLLALMADTLAAGLLLEEAGADLAEGDARKALVARMFVEGRLAPPPRRGILPGRDWSSHHFETLVGYEPVDREALTT